MIGCYKSIPSEESRLNLYMQVLQPSFDDSHLVKS